MDFNATIDLIIRDLEEAREIIDDLKKYPGVPHLQVELAKSKCKSAGEVIGMLKSIEKTEDRRRKTEDRGPKTEDRRQETEDRRQETEDRRRKTEDGGPKTEGRRPETEDRKQETPPVKKSSESAIIGDSFGHLTNRLNEQMGSHKGEDERSGKMKSKHLSNLSDAIGINDRFLFIREIFNGNKDTYTQAISRLDNSVNLSDAKAIIMSYTGNSSENEAMKQLLDLVKRKLPSNE